MSVATEIARLQSAKADIKQSIENKGVTVPSSEKISSYNTYIDSISQGVPQLDVGGKNPVLVKDYVEVIPFSETDYPSITPSTTRSRIYAGEQLFTENVDLDNYDYVLKTKIMIDVIYTEEPPFSSSFVKKMILGAVFNIFRIYEEKISYNLNECAGMSSARIELFHQSNQTVDRTFGAAGGAFHIDSNSANLINRNCSLRANSNAIYVTVNANQMTEDSFDLIDTTKSTITFDYKLYRVDKGTASCGVARQDMVDYVLGE